MEQRKLILYIAMSLDGYIAAPGDDLSFLNPMMKEEEDYGYGAFIKTVDTVILGRKTYDWVMKQVDTFPHADKEAYVITSKARPPVGNTHFYTGELKELIASLKQKKGNTIFCDGGAVLVNALLKDRLIDELIISVIPVLLSGGTRLFAGNNQSQTLVLKECKTYSTGLVQLHYTADRPLSV